MTDLFGDNEPPRPRKRSGQRPGWTRCYGGTGGKWQHESGWVVKHCGHPTALFPYTAGPPGYTGAELPALIAKNGMAFSRLAYAQEAVERLLMSPGRLQAFFRAVHYVRDE